MAHSELAAEAVQMVSLWSESFKRATIFFTFTSIPAMLLKLYSLYLRLITS